MRLNSTLCFLFVLMLAGSSQAAVKYYDASRDNGSPGDSFLNSTGLCPPARTTLGDSFGFFEVTDDGSGTVTLSRFQSEGETIADLKPEDGLQTIFGPGAFVFIINVSTTTVAAPHVSNTTGVGGHGPSSTAPGGSAEWGVVSGFAVTGFAFCITSPTSICTNAGFAHGETLPRTLPSTSYDLGTWNFDGIGDMEAAQGLITRTSNGGLTNNGARYRGAFVGSALPALPLLGFGALAVSLAIVGGRRMIGRK